MKVKLYVNGILDSISFLENFDLFNDSPLFIGNTPAMSEDCTTNMYIDDVRYYDTEIKGYEI